MVSACAACDCMCQKETGCREVAELGTQMWPLQPLLLLLRCRVPQVGTQDGQPPGSSRATCRNGMFGVPVSSRLSPPSAVSLKTGI